MNATRKGALFAFCAAAVWFFPTAAHAQLPDFNLNRLDQAHLDSLAALTAKRVREAKLVEKEPKILGARGLSFDHPHAQLAFIMALLAWRERKRQLGLSGKLRSQNPELGVAGGGRVTDDRQRGINDGY